MSISARNTLAAALTALGLALAGGAFAQGIFIIRPRPPIPMPTPSISVRSVKVATTIRDSVAETMVEQKFANPASVAQEGTYVFPLPAGAAVSSFSLRSGDRVLEGKILGKDEARAYYESIVRSMKDPALLEYVGTGVFRSSVFPIPAQGECTLTLRYQELLKPTGGLFRFIYPLSTGRFSSQPVQTSSVSVTLKTSAALKTVYSPSHDVSVRREDEHTARASWEGANDVPDRDFSLYFATAPGDVGLSLLTYQTGDKDGYFLLLANPKTQVAQEQILPKQVVFVLDRTGSMAENDKLVQAKAALKYCLASLHPKDTFDVISFNESPDLLFRSLQPATEANVGKAQAFIRDLTATGGTNIDEALRATLGLLKRDGGKQKMVVFLTDGLPTVGETDTTKILANVKLQENTATASSADLPSSAAALQARVFSFGVGYDVNVPFLDELAQVTRADSDYVRPNENIEAIVSGFYAKVSSPMLANIRLEFDGVETNDVYPKMLPDLFVGNQLVITGRYRGTAPGSVKLIGSARGKEQAFRLDKAFSDEAAQSSLVPRIWAMRKIGYLLDEVRLHQNKEVTDEIVRLSKEYGIVTPYTSYLADDRPGSVSISSNGSASSYHFRLSDADGKANLDALSSGGYGVAGPDATYLGLNAQGYRRSEQAPALNQAQKMDNAIRASGGALRGPQGTAGPAGAFGGGRASLGRNYADTAQSVREQKGSSNQQPLYRQVADASSVQTVGTRVFYRRDNIWFDNNYKSDQKVTKVKALSDAHFQLLHAVPELNRYAAIGDEVVVTIGKNAIQFGKEGQDRLSDAELKALSGR